MTLEDNTIRGTGPAIFDRLYAGNTGDYNSSGAFNKLYSDAPELYTEDGTLYTGSSYSVKMLVDSFTTDSAIRTLDTAQFSITFTTAGEGDTDGYPYDGRASRATVIRGSSVGNNSLFYANVQLDLVNIILDGGSETGISPNSNTRILDINSGDKTVTLGANATLQNAVMTGYGGGTYVNNGKFTVDGGVIRNCSAKYGGGIYIAKDKTVELKAGNIYRCYATENGGGVNVAYGEFIMSGGTISYCGLDNNNLPRTKNGGGIYVNGRKKFYMTGGSVINNSSTTTGGGIAIAADSSRLYFTGRVNVSGNTCSASVASGNTCNVELNKNSKLVINTYNGGLRPGSYIGVYVPGDDSTNPYKDYGGEKDNFGTFAAGDNTTTFYSFTNDRNGLKGGIIENAAPNTIYWIQIFSLQVSKVVEASSSNPVPADEEFSFTVRISGRASATGQLNAKDIDSSTGDYGQMEFTSNGTDMTIATFTLKAGESVTAMNLSEGLDYQVIENLTEEQQNKYATLPATVYSGKIGENKGWEDKDPYTSIVKMINILPVCKITRPGGQLLYTRYVYNENKEEKAFYVPAVYTELTGDDGSFSALENTTFYQSNGNSPTAYNVKSGGAQIKMLTAEYKQSEAITLPDSINGTITLTTAGRSDTLFPKQDQGTTSTIKRGFDSDSMFRVKGKLDLTNIILDGAKGTYQLTENGGIVKVPDGGSLTIREDAVLQNSKTSGNGGAVYVGSGGTVTMTSGKIDKNEVNGDGQGAGIYLAYDSINKYGTLKLSGDPDFGGKGTDVGGNITTSNGNYKAGDLVAKTNGGKAYSKRRQDIYIAGFEGDDGDRSAASLVVSGDITSGDGTIWVWAAESPHYKTLQQFAVIEGHSSTNSLKAFRNARVDTDTGADSLDTYLYGINRDDYVCWYGVDGSRRVILRKVGEVSSGKYRSLSGAKFTVYGSATSTTPVTDKNGNKLEGLESGDSGIIYAGELNYGTYYVKETTVPSGYSVPDSARFIITVNENGAGYLKSDDSWSRMVYVG